MSVRKAAATLIANVMKKHGLRSVDELTCPDMRALAESLRPKRNHGPSERRGIGMHSNADMFRGL